MNNKKMIEILETIDNGKHHTIDEIAASKEKKYGTTIHIKNEMLNLKEEMYVEKVEKVYKLTKKGKLLLKSLKHVQTIKKTKVI